MNQEDYLETKEEKQRLRILQSFEACSTEEDLKSAAYVVSDIIKKLSAEDQDYLRTMYKSRLQAIKDAAKPEPKVLKGE